MLKREEIFKLNEFQYEIICIDCDNEYNLSKNNLVHCITPMKQKLLDLIYFYINNKKTFSFDKNKTLNVLFNY